MKDTPVVLLEELARRFDELCNERMQVGQEKYGPTTWLQVNTMDEALLELADMINYTRMNAVKLMLIQMYINGEIDQTGQFIPTNPEH